MLIFTIFIGLHLLKLSTSKTVISSMTS